MEYIRAHGSDHYPTPSPVSGNIFNTSKPSVHFGLNTLSSFSQLEYEETTMPADAGAADVGTNKSVGYAQAPDAPSVRQESIRLSVPRPPPAVLPHRVFVGWFTVTYV